MPDPTWFSTLDADTQAHITGKGWEKLEPAAAAAEASKAHLAAQKFIGVPAEQLLKLPKDAADPTFQAAYDRIFGMVTPTTADAYKFDGVKFKDGSELDAGDVDFVRNLAVKFKLPTTVAAGIAADLAARSDTADGEAAAAVETTKAANNAYLRAAYGADHDFKLFGAQRAVEASGLPASILDHIMTLPQEEYRKGVDALVALGQRMNEVPMHRGTGSPIVDPTLGLTPDAAAERLKAFTTDVGLRAKFLANDTETVANWTKLTSIIAGGRVAPR
jgi:hypothetical protein